MTTQIVKMIAPVTDGKDPNDARNDDGFKGRAEEEINASTEQSNGNSNQQHGCNGKEYHMEHGGIKADNTDPFAKLEGCALTDEEFNNLKDAEMLYPKILVSQHIINIAAPPGAGKTTIMMYICEQLASQGVRVMYINADCPPDAAKVYHSIAAKYDSFTMILPDFKGITMDEVHVMIDEMVRNGDRMDDTLFVFDTMKKCVDTMTKGKVSDWYKWLRRIPPLGATIVQLMHTNKYTDDDGKLIYEGVADTKNDTDELFYMYADEEADGSKKVTIEHEKVRSFGLEEVTFTIHPDWTVTQDADVTDVRASNLKRKKQANDSGIITDILGAIYQLGKDGTAATQARICKILKGSHNHKSVERVIRQQKGELWTITKGIGPEKILTEIEKSG